jgi:nucleoside-diphosphate-sugar epimerase
MNIFLTGGTGFIGSHFLKTSLECGHSVTALKRSQKSSTKIILTEEPNWLIKSFDEVVESDFENVDVIVHLAAHSANVPYDSLLNCIKFNVEEPLKLFEKAVKAGVNNFIVAGSCFEYGRSGERYDFIPVDAPLEPTQTYPASKALSSIAFHQFAYQNQVNLNYMRIFQVYGEGEEENRLWPSLRKAALSGNDFPMTKGEQVRDFIEVSEVAECFLNEAERLVVEKDSKSPFVFKNIGSGNPWTILEFSKFWWNKWEAKGQLQVGLLPYREGEVMRYVPEI